ncbi:hypothetical protein H4582DRAFT_2067114 [Lactarius indigo]|nr:hypothetical protein H4582DRAFT_2067114 [Lactarius indigo]
MSLYTVPLGQMYQTHLAAGGLPEDYQGKDHPHKVGDSEDSLGGSLEEHQKEEYQMKVSWQCLIEECYSFFPSSRGVNISKWVLAMLTWLNGQIQGWHILNK